MEPHQSTTPFGRRSLSLAMVASQRAARDCAPGLVAHKWEVFRNICEGRLILGVPERAMAVLDALLSFHPETALRAGDEMVVFPSNANLALRAHGMAPATLRRHLSALVEAGLIVRRDSPNGKRFARKSRDGAIEQAFGFDLTPLVARANEFASLADRVRTDRMALVLARERITICRRDIVKMMTLAGDEGIPGDWTSVRAAYRELVGRIPRLGTLRDLEPIAEELSLFAIEVQNLLEDQVFSIKGSANESQNERHIQNSNPNLPIESEPVLRARRGGECENLSPNAKPLQRSFPLPMVLDACPDIGDYAKGGVASWRDLMVATALVRPMLGISPSAFEAAERVFGPEDAAVVIAALLQKGGAVSSAGGYLRSLTAKAEAGEFSLGPMLMALLRLRRSEKKRA